jgi:hypothetical protein
MSPNAFGDDYCDEIEIRDEEPRDVGSDDTVDTTNEDTTADEMIPVLSLRVIVL